MGDRLRAGILSRSSDAVRSQITLDTRFWFLLHSANVAAAAGGGNDVTVKLQQCSERLPEGILHQKSWSPERL